MLAFLIGTLLLSAAPDASNKWDGIVIVSCKQPNCEPCVEQERVMVELSRDGWSAWMYDLSKQNTWHPDRHIKVTPTTIVYVDGREYQVWEGLASKEAILTAVRGAAINRAIPPGLVAPKPEVKKGEEKEPPGASPEAIAEFLNRFYEDFPDAKPPRQPATKPEFPPIAKLPAEPAPPVIPPAVPPVAPPAAPPAKPAVNSQRYVVRVQRGASWGSGVIIQANGQNAWVATVWHVLSHGSGQPVIWILKDGGGWNAVPGVIDGSDEAWDVACIRIADPGIGCAAKAAEVPQAGDSIYGYGWASPQGGNYRATSGRLLGFRSRSGSTQGWMHYGGGSRLGDSGGPVLNSQGEVVGLISETNGQASYGPCLPVLRNVLPWLASRLARSSPIGPMREKPKPVVTAAPADSLVTVGRTYPGVVMFGYGRRDTWLDQIAQSAANAQARLNRCGHHEWSSAFQKILGRYGGSPSEIAAMSTLFSSNADSDQMAKQLYDAWRTSPGHWKTLVAGHDLWGVGMTRGSGGSWYGTIVVVDHPSRIPQSAPPTVVEPAPSIPVPDFNTKPAPAPAGACPPGKCPGGVCPTQPVIPMLEIPSPGAWGRELLNQQRQPCPPGGS